MQNFTEDLTIPSLTLQRIQKVNEKNSEVFSDTKFEGKKNEGSRQDIKMERFIYSKSYSHLNCPSEIF